MDIKYFILQVEDKPQAIGFHGERKIIANVNIEAKNEKGNTIKIEISDYKNEKLFNQIKEIIQENL